MKARGRGSAGCAVARRRGKGDQGNMLALEAVFLALLLFTSMAVVLSVEPQGSASRVTRAPLEALVGDLLQGMEEAPAGPTYQNVLERIVAKAAQGNRTAFDDLVRRTMPDGAECRLWLDNGHDRRLLIGSPERIARESVSAARMHRPAWAYAFAVPTIDLLGEGQPLPVQAYEVSQGALVKEHGVPVTATLTTDAGVLGRAALTSVRPGPTVSLYLLDEAGQPGFAHADAPTASQSTRIHNVSAPGPLASPHTFEVSRGMTTLDALLAIDATTVDYRVNLTAPDGTAHPIVASAPGNYSLAVSSPANGTWTFTAQGTVQGGSPSVRLTVDETGLEGNRNWSVVLRSETATPLPAGVKLNVTLPQAFSAVDLTPLAQAGWRNITVRDDAARGQWVSAELDSALANATRTLQVTARRPVSVDALYAVQAALSGTASHRAVFVLGSTTGNTSSANTIEREPFLSVPKPQAPGASALWGVVVPNPRPAASGAFNATVLDLRTADGSALFAAVEGVAPASGWTLVSPSHVRWTGNLTVDSNRAQAFAARIATLDALTPHEPALAVPLGFAHGALPIMTESERPYVLALNVPPPQDILGAAQAGYEAPPGGQERRNATLGVDAVQRGLAVRGNATYGVTSWANITALQEPLRSGLARSHLNLTALTARVGDSVNVTVDFQALFDEVTAGAAASIANWTVDLRVFDPAQPFLALRDMRPSPHARFGAADLSLQTLPTGVAGIEPWTLGAADAEVRTRAVAELRLTVPPGAFYGPHAVLAEASFVVSDGAGTSMSQTARQLAVLDVVPDGGAGAAGVYWATLECWLQDW